MSAIIKTSRSLATKACKRQRTVTLDVCNEGKRSDGKLARFVWGEGWGNTPDASREGAPRLYSTSCAARRYWTNTCAAYRAAEAAIFDDGQGGWWVW